MSAAYKEVEVDSANVRGSRQGQPEGSDDLLRLTLTVDATTAVMTILDKMVDLATTRRLPGDMVLFAKEARDQFANAVEGGIGGWGYVKSEPGKVRELVGDPQNDDDSKEKGS